MGKRIWNNTTSGSDDRAEESTDFANEGKKPLNPTRFEKIIEALSGVETKFIENTAKNTFQVNLYGVVNNYDEVVRRIDKLKPAHLLCDIRISDVMESETALNYAIVSGSCEYSSSIVSEV